MYSYAPYAILTTIDILLIILVRTRNKRKMSLSGKVLAKKTNVNALILGLSILFIVFTFPKILVDILHDKMIYLEIGLLLDFLSNSIRFSYHGFNIFILIATNKRFRNELRKFANSIFLSPFNQSSVRAKSNKAR